MKRTIITICAIVLAIAILLPLWLIFKPEAATEATITEDDLINLEQINADRLYILPITTREDVKKITIDNEYGKYSFVYYTELDGEEVNTFKVEGFEKFLFDEYNFSSILSYALNTLTTFPKKAAETRQWRVVNEATNEQLLTYGLLAQKRTDSAGKEYSYSPTKVTVEFKSKANATGLEKYTLVIGDLVPAKNGYYAMLEGYSSVYIVSAGNKIFTESSLKRGILDTALTEAISINNVNNYAVYKDGEKSIEIDYVIEKNRPFYDNMANVIKYPKNLTLDADAFTSALSHIEAISGNEIMELGEAVYENYEKYGLKISKTDLQYNIENNAFVLSYKAYPTDNSISDGKLYSQQVVFSEKQSTEDEGDFYYAWSTSREVIVKISASSMPILQYEPVDYINNRLLDTYFSSVEHMEFLYNGFLYEGKPFDIDARFTLSGKAGEQSALVTKFGSADEEIGVDIFNEKVDPARFYNLNQVFGTLLTHCAYSKSDFKLQNVADTPFAKLSVSVYAKDTRSSFADKTTYEGGNIICTSDKLSGLYMYFDENGEPYFFRRKTNASGDFRPLTDANGNYIRYTAEQVGTVTWIEKRYGYEFYEIKGYDGIGDEQNRIIAGCRLTVTTVTYTYINGEITSSEEVSVQNEGEGMCVAYEGISDLFTNVYKTLNDIEFDYTKD